VHSARRLTAPPSPPRAPSLPTLLADGCSVGARRRRSPIQRAGRRRSTRTITTPSLRASSCTIAPAGRSVQHVACELLLSSAAQSAHAHAVLCRARRGGTGTKRTQTHALRDAERVRLSAHSADGLCLMLQVEQQRPAMDEVRPPRRASRSAHWCQCLHHNTPILGHVLNVWTRALVLFRSNPISANAPQTPRHSWEKLFFGVCRGGGARAGGGGGGGLAKPGVRFGQTAP
jgi:hypothetical protein